MKARIKPCHCPDCNRNVSHHKCLICHQMHPFAPANSSLWVKFPRVGIYLSDTIKRFNTWRQT